MEIHDCNGPGDWSGDAIRRRYLEHARRFGQREIRELKSIESTQGNARWIHPLMDDVIAGIEEGDLACIELGVEFVQSGHQQAFGKILHSNVARALRRANLSPDQIVNLRRRILGMLVAGQVPHEFKQYAKLLRKIGLGSDWDQIRARVDESNPYVMRFVKYFDSIATKRPSG